MMPLDRNQTKGMELVGSDSQCHNLDALSESVYYTVQSHTTAHQQWQTLHGTYEKKATATKIYLIQHLYNLQMKDLSDTLIA